MRARAVVPSLLSFTFVALLLAGGAKPAWAQKSAEVDLSRIELAIGLTINDVAPDVNAAPACVELSLPCSHGRPERFSGLGLDVSVARNLSPTLAIAGDVSTFTHDWDVRESPLVVRRATTRVTSFFLGPRVSTGFFDPGTGDKYPGRFFGQVLVGGETGSATSLRPALLVGGGADFMVARIGSRGTGSSPALTLRWSLDYRLSPAARDVYSGYRLMLGVLFGPKVKPLPSVRQ